MGYGYIQVLTGAYESPEAHMLLVLNIYMYMYIYIVLCMLQLQEWLYTVYGPSVGVDQMTMLLLQAIKTVLM